MTRIAIVEKDKCNPIKCGNFLCMRYCPVNRMEEECIVENDNSIIINEELCTGCGICVHKCPFDAISIVNLPEALTQDPIHQYGPNGFRLYSLPTPIFGKVVGILGKNGIGKSTAIKILADVLKPNFGNYKTPEENNYEKLIEFFKGTEAQNFFEKVKAGKIKVSYKLQQVDLIAKQFKGKVRELLEKVDEKGQLEYITKELSLTKVLERNIEDISGGELQRVAIAATVLKKANVYIFDEPTSYLDIKQRIKVSKFIRNLADENTAVLVVEHDLIILDYMTDLVHLMYGQESGYGIISQTKATRTGINIYLDGYLKEENIRFRNYKIKFNVSPPEEAVTSTELVSWENLSK
ncbi:MAG: ribosome biogenesis/translation initiation ATPase RLI, partial [Nanoarchaeota archaeon]|nr:ribosome biogenesis/translation initiation ATPase RLI [Nanoarchaeota archaeon]